MNKLVKDVEDIVTTLLYPAQYIAGSAYPPFNIIKVNDNETVLELAVAGFKESELSVSVDVRTLTISGEKATGPETTEREFLHKGIGMRSFKKTFPLSRYAVVDEAEYADGILSVFVHHVPPEKTKPNTIPINRTEKQLLTE